MRRIGQLDDAQHVERFFAYLQQQGVVAEVLEDEPGWTIWISDENSVEIARAAFVEFQADPEAERYLAAQADMVQEANGNGAAYGVEPTPPSEPVVAEPAASRSPLRRRFAFPIRRGYTICIAGLSLLGAVVIDFNLDSPAGRWMAFCDSPSTAHGLDTLNNILSGQLWRLISPSFAYIDVLQLVLSVIFLYRFGVLIESLRGAVVLGLLILGAASFANLAQAIGPVDPAIKGLAGSANFAGMSGVVYGLFGFVWAQSLRRPKDPLQMDMLTILLLVGWQAVCIGSPELGFPNVGHVAGLVYGLIAGAIYTPKALTPEEPPTDSSETPSRTDR